LCFGVTVSKISLSVHMIKGNDKFWRKHWPIIIIVWLHHCRCVTQQSVRVWPKWRSINSHCNGWNVTQMWNRVFVSAHAIIVFLYTNTAHTDVHCPYHSLSILTIVRDNLTASLHLWACRLNARDCFWKWDSKCNQGPLKTI
jgi:hypothetical protein